MLEGPLLLVSANCASTSKITIAVFIAHAELWAENLRVQETEPHMYLGGKLVVAPLRK